MVCITQGFINQAANKNERWGDLLLSLYDDESMPITLSPF